MSRVGEGLIFHQHLPQAPKQQILAVEVGAVARRPFGPLGRSDGEFRSVPGPLAVTGGASARASGAVGKLKGRGG